MTPSNLQTIRRALGLSQTEFGALIGHPASTVGAWERKGADAALSANTLHALRAAIDREFGLLLSLDDLLSSTFRPDRVKPEHVQRVFAFRARRQMAAATPA